MNIFRLRSFSVVAVMALAIFLGASAFSNSSFQEEPKRNLKVLPKNTTHEQLEAIMKNFTASLGVKCNFCHAPTADGAHLDFASDAKPEKGWARDMMRMTAKINKKFFKVDVKNLNGKTAAVSCVTCHNGNTKPKAAI
jgi:hypothetical protein